MGEEFPLRTAKEVLAARAAQVVMLRLRGGVNRKKMSGWPPCENRSTRKQWRRRERIFRSATKRHERMLWLHHEKDPYVAFTRQLVLRETKPSYALNLWIAFEQTFKILGWGPVPPAVSAVTKKLRGDTRTQNTTHPPAMTVRHLKMIERRFAKRWPRHFAVLQVAFLLGQRLPDMVQLSVESFREHSDSLVIAVTLGKVMQFKHPFVLPLAWHLPHTKAILRARDRAVKKGYYFVLTRANTAEQRRKATTKIRTMLHSVGRVRPPTEGGTIGGDRTPRRLQIGSVRRGGLQHMATAGFSLNRILEFSKHSDVPMLLRYLDDGGAATHHRRRLRDAVTLFYQGGRLLESPEAILD